MTKTETGYIYGKTALSDEEYQKARKILLDLQAENLKLTEEGYGPFLAAIYDKEGNLIAKMPNTVAKDNCCLCHAEVNTIRQANEKLKTYDLAPFELSIYVTAEPCIMCAGAIMWSGIKRVFYGVNSFDVERITGFDEGFKPDWIKEFTDRNIEVYGEIEAQAGRDVLEKYVSTGKEIYKPSCDR
ncbi:MAG: nucleoside deaminase [Candidatus Gastranaerophilales bacterium]|nr:nucleoside deaminase [Candidatus Gastranaerophilales bacterium]